MNNKAVRIESFQGYVHYYIEDEYLGLFVFEKGELSDHRGIIRQNRITIDNSNLYKVMKTGLFALLNHFLAEKKLLDNETLQVVKAAIVKKSDTVLKDVSNEVIISNMLGLNNDKKDI